ATIRRAGLLGSLAAIAAVVISFLPLLEVFHSPIVGLVSLAIILTTLIAKVKLPFNIPGALGALIVGGTMYWFMEFGGAMAGSPSTAWTDYRPQWDAPSAGPQTMEALSGVLFQLSTA